MGVVGIRSVGMLLKQIASKKLAQDKSLNVYNYQKRYYCKIYLIG